MEKARVKNKRKRIEIKDTKENRLLLERVINDISQLYFNTGLTIDAFILPPEWKELLDKIYTPEKTMHITKEMGTCYEGDYSGIIKIFTNTARHFEVVI